MKKILLLMILCVPVFSGISAQEVLRRPATLLEDEKKLQEPQRSAADGK